MKTRHEFMAAREPAPVTKAEAQSAYNRVHRQHPVLGHNAILREAARLCKTDLATFKRAWTSRSGSDTAVNGAVPPRRTFTA